VDEYALDDAEDEPYGRQRDFLEILKVTFEFS
jgi:hypothetical protein